MTKHDIVIIKYDRKAYSVLDNGIEIGFFNSNEKAEKCAKNRIDALNRIHEQGDKANG